MKKRIFLMLFTLIFLSFVKEADASSLIKKFLESIFSNGTSVNGPDAVDSYLSKTNLVNASGNLAIENGFKAQLLRWTYNLGGFFGLGAVFGIVYGSLMLTLTGGEEEKIKKAKGIIKWSIIGFVGVILAGSIIKIIIEFFYGLG